MCTGIEIALFIGAGLAASQQIVAGEEQKGDAKVQANQMDLDAQAELDAANERADLIRKAGAKTRSNARAAYAAAGVDVGVGSPVLIDEEVATDVESDAWSEVLTGNSQARRMRSQADQIRRGGKAAADTGYQRAFGTVLGAAGTAYKTSWSGTPKAQQSPAPIEDRSITVND